jgi:hypothetical protein
MEEKYKPVIALAVVLGLLIYGGLYYGTGSEELPQILPQLIPPTTGCGYNVIGLSKADFLSNDAKLNWQDAILLTVVHNTENECAIGNWKKEDINQKLENKKIDYDFAIKLDSKQQTCTYNINRKYVGETRGAYKGIYKMESYHTDCEVPFGGCTNWVTDCMKKDKYYSYKCWDIVPYVTKTCYCFYNTREGWYGKLSDPKYDFPVEVTVAGKEKLPPVTIGGVGQTHALIGDKVYAEWNGNLVSGVSCPDAKGDYVATYSDTNGWNTVETEDWNKYEDYDESGFKLCVSGATADTVSQCIKEYNFRKERALSRWRTIAWDWGYPYYEQKESGDETGGRVVLDVDKQIQYPVLGFHVNAKWMGIYTPVGIPKITSAPEKIQVKSGETTYFTVKVKNIGEATGSFDVYAECSPGFSSWRRESINPVPDEVIPVTLDISGSCPTGEKTGTCRVKAVGKTKTDISDDIPITCSPLPICDPEGKKRCSEDELNVEICRNGNWEISEECDFGCTVKAGVPACKVLKCTKDKDCDDNDPATIDRCNVDIFGNSYCSNERIPNVGICGNGICEPIYGEDYKNCPIDCGACGNGVCEPGETNANCEVDCPAVCGNDICEKGETPETCAEDCAVCPPYKLGPFEIPDVGCIFWNWLMEFFKTVGMIVVIIIILIVLIVAFVPGVKWAIAKKVLR